MALAKSLRLCLLIEALVLFNLLIDLGSVGVVVRKRRVNLRLVQVRIVHQQIADGIAFVDKSDRDILHAPLPGIGRTVESSDGTRFTTTGPLDGGIPEEDLRLRGAGDLIGVQQSGLPQFRIADVENQVGLMRMAQSDSRLLLERDPDLTSPRGQAMRTLLWLMGRDQAIHMLSVG